MKKGFFQHQALRVLQQEKYAVMLATVLAAVPYMDWLALALMSLVTLRYGGRAGFKIFVPVVLMQVLGAVFSMPVLVASMVGVLNVFPCYFASYVLKKTSSWRVVFSVLLGLVVLGGMMLQTFLPEFIMQQYMHLESLIQHLALSQKNVLNFWGNRGITPLILANYLLGVQAASFAFSAIIPILFARSLQSQLFYPKGFREEMLAFRGDKTSLSVLIVMGVLAYHEQLLAINCLPLVLFYFILAGLSFSAYMLSHMKPFALMLLLILPMIFLSWVILPFYILIGVLDSLFNFRLYVSSKAKQTT